MRSQNDGPFRISVLAISTDFSPHHFKSSFDITFRYRLNGPSNPLELDLEMITRSAQNNTLSKKQHSL